jgi:RNA polymerase sigma factor (sigma-70 family)
MRQLPAPDRATWQTITQAYNQQSAQQLSPASRATPALLEQWLTHAAKLVRHALHPPVRSLNLAASADQADELQDFLPGDAEATPMALLLSQEALQERQTRWGQIDQVLTDAIAQLKPDLQDILVLYYAQQLTQQQIAAHLTTKQYTVSRRLSSAKEALLLALAHWSQAQLHSSPSSTALKGMSVLLEEWLDAHYQRLAPSSKEAAT